ncbi:MAG: hypothetical protein QF662_07675, partial [Phycisphaerae bacterium]|nr:hypothetical protein [Phycisphaerae bacterium]
GELLFFWLVVFGYVSRRCELEADLYAIQATTCLAGCTPSEAAILGTKESDRAVWADAICLHKAVVFAEALERIARLNGISPQARSWRHFSIARRVRFVIAMAENPDLAWHFERRLKRTKRLLILFAAASISYLALLQFLPE